MSNNASKPDSTKGAAMKKKLDKMEQENIERMATISLRIREAVRSAMPAPAEQFFHVMVPGKVLNFNDYMAGFDDNGKLTKITLPAVTELNQAILCDDMPALSPIQLGPTGKSVSRSYGAILSKLVPSGTTVGVEVGDPNNLTDAEKRYERAMEWLLAEDPRNPGKSHLQTYIAKQKIYTDAEERKIKKYEEARVRIANDPMRKTDGERRAAYDRWVSENGRSLRNDVEGAYKDWVIHGRKEAVEYWFAVVDNDSVMARVEQSKEAMRSSTVMNADGSVSYPKVSLSPSNWAWLAKQKMLSGKNATKTASQLTWEILRLERKNRMMEALINKKPKATPAPVPDEETANKELKAAMDDYVQKCAIRDNKQRDTNATDDEKSKATAAALVAKENLDKANEKFNKEGIDRLSALSVKALDELYQSSTKGLQLEVAKNEETIKALTAEREATLKENVDDPLLKDVLPSETAESKAKAPATPVDRPDYFTSITLEVSSSLEMSKSSQQSVQSQLQVQAAYAGATGGVGGSHTQSSADVEKQMAKSDVKISFECMRVDIERPWLRPELFYDEDLCPAPGVTISPGPVVLSALMDPESTKDPSLQLKQREREEELQRYRAFPLYPTAFLLACNVVLEISGETSAIQSHFDTSSTAASVSIGYGPFSIAPAVNTSDTNERSTCETTSSGCRITMKSPQIIGWISEIVPALPRKNQVPAPAGSGSTAAAVTF